MTYPENTPSVDDMLNMPTGELAQMPVELLAGLQGELDHASKHLKAATARFNAALEVRYEVVSRMLWKFPGGVLRAIEGSFFQAARSRGIGSRG